MHLKHACLPIPPPERVAIYEVSAARPKWGAARRPTIPNWGAHPIGPGEGCSASTVVAMGLRDVERAIERGVDGVLGRVFRAEVTPIEIEKLSLIHI